MLYHDKNPHGGDRYRRPIRIDFSANTNPLGTPESVKEAVKRSCDRLDHYPDPYCQELVRGIAEKEQVDPDWVLCGNGAAEVIDLYMRALSPRHALEAVPTFSEYERSLKVVGGRLEKILLDADRNFAWTRALTRELEARKPDLLLLCNPNNPTGRLLPPVELDRLLCLCREQGTRVFLDECFMDLADSDQSRKKDLASFSGLFILKAFTKNFGMAGLRVGYGLSSDEKLLQKMSRQGQPWNLSLPALLGACAALKEDAFLLRAKQMIREERKNLQAGLEKAGFLVCPSQTNFLLFYGPTGLDRELLEEGIAIRNCANYDGLGFGWYRIAVRRPEENRELLLALERRK